MFKYRVKTQNKKNLKSKARWIYWADGFKKNVILQKFNW